MVSMLVLLPFFVVIPLLGKQAHVQYKANEALRYTVWERTVWPGGGVTHDYTDNFKSDDQIRVEAQDRVLGHPGAGIRPLRDVVDDDATVDPLLTDLFGREMLANAPGERSPLVVNTTAGASPIEVGQGAGPAVYQDLLNLSNDQFVRGDFAVTVIPAIEDWGRLSLRGRDRGAGDGQRHGRDDLRRHFKRGAILTDTWAAPNESTYRGRIAGAVWDHEVRGISAPWLSRIAEISDGYAAMNPFVSGDWVFGEARHGLGGQFIPDSGVVPRRYVAD